MSEENRLGYEENYNDGSQNVSESTSPIHNSHKFINTNEMKKNNNIFSMNRPNFMFKPQFKNNTTNSNKKEKSSEQVPPHILRIKPQQKNRTSLLKRIQNLFFTPAKNDGNPKESSRDYDHEICAIEEESINNFNKLKEVKNFFQEETQQKLIQSDQIDKITNKYFQIREKKIFHDGCGILKLSEKNDFEKIKEYHDDWPLLQFRILIKTIKTWISYICLIIILNPIFEYLTMTVIILNSIFLALETPNEEGPSYISESDDYFLAIYTTEMILKIFGLGVISSKTAYFRDPWNLLDFVIVISAYIPYFTGSNSSVSLSGLRSLRVLRPLRTISSIQSLKNLIGTVLEAIPTLLEIIVVLLFVFLIFAIAGLQLFSGLFKKKCIKATTGEELDSSFLCGRYECPEGYVCAETYRNPNYGVSNFDNIFSAILMVFQIVTLEGWTDVMTYVEQTFSEYAVTYFIVLVFLGSFFLLNLTLAAIIVKYNEKQLLAGGVTTDENMKEHMKKFKKKNNKKSKKSFIEDNVVKVNFRFFIVYCNERYQKYTNVYKSKQIKPQKESKSILTSLGLRRVKKLKNVIKARSSFNAIAKNRQSNSTQLTISDANLLKKINESSVSNNLKKQINFFPNTGVSNQIPSIVNFAPFHSKNGEDKPKDNYAIQRQEKEQNEGSFGLLKNLDMQETNLVDVGEEEENNFIDQITFMKNRMQGLNARRTTNYRSINRRNTKFLFKSLKSKSSFESLPHYGSFSPIKKIYSETEIYDNNDSGFKNTTNDIVDNEVINDENESSFKLSDDSEDENQANNIHTNENSSSSSDERESQKKEFTNILINKQKSLMNDFLLKKKFFFDEEFYPQPIINNVQPPAAENIVFKYPDEKLEIPQIIDNYSRIHKDDRNFFNNIFKSMASVKPQEIANRPRNQRRKGTNIKKGVVYANIIKKKKNQSVFDKNYSQHQALKYLMKLPDNKLKRYIDFTQYFNPRSIYNSIDDVLPSHNINLQNKIDNQKNDLIKKVKLMMIYKKKRHRTSTKSY